MSITALDAIPSLSKIIAERIIAIQQRHHAETGLWLSVGDAFRELENADDTPPEPDEPPAKADLLRVQAWLVAEYYDPQAIKWIMADLARWGTAKFTPWLEDSDRPHVEEMLHPSQWPPVWASTRVDLTPHGLSLAVV